MFFKRKCWLCNRKGKDLEYEEIYNARKSNSLEQDSYKRKYYHLDCMKETICKDQPDNIINIRRALVLNKIRNTRLEEEKQYRKRFFEELDEAKEDLCSG